MHESKRRGRYSFAVDYTPMNKDITRGVNEENTVIVIITGTW